MARDRSRRRAKKGREARLLEALEPFANVDIPARHKRSGDDVWCYVGKRDEGVAPDLTIEDFERACAIIKDISLRR